MKKVSIGIFLCGILLGGCSLKYVKTETEDIALPGPYDLKVAYAVGPSGVYGTLKCQEIGKLVHVKKTFYKRKYMGIYSTDEDWKWWVGFVGVYSASAFTSWNLGYLDGFIYPIALIPTKFIWPPTKVHIEEDTVPGVRVFGKKRITIRSQSKEKSFRTDSEGEVRFPLRDFITAPEKTVALRVIDREGRIADVTIPASDIVRAQKAEDEAKELLAKVEIFKKQKRYSEALDLCKKIHKEYKYTHAAEIIEKRDEIDKLKTAVISQDLDKMANRDLGDFLKRKGFTEPECAVVLLRLGRIDEGSQIFAITSGLKLPLSSEEAWSFFQNLNAYQKFYALLKLVEKTVGKKSLYKSQMLKDWFGSLLANKLAFISSSEMG